MPSRTHVPAYQQLDDEVEGLVERINWRWGTDTWQPVVYLKEHYGPADMIGPAPAGPFCVVSSLHDGMNLVAKEFVASRDRRGRRAGPEPVHRGGPGADRRAAGQPVRRRRDGRGDAARPEMPAEERQRRMRRMRAAVAENNIYRWAGKILSALLRIDIPEAL